MKTYLDNALKNTPLRVQLVAIVLLLVTLALVITGVTATSALRGYLLDRVDTQLNATVRDQLQRGTDEPVPVGPRSQTAGIAGPALISGFYVNRVDREGNGEGRLQLPRRAVESAPKLPTLNAEKVAELEGSPFTVPSDGVGHSWRVLTVATSDGAIVVGTNLSDVESTVNRLQRMVLVVSVIVLVLLGVFGYFLVRMRLRKLVLVEQTAERIANGDLTLRVPDLGSKTEIGKLASSLNVMLGQIETSFEAQRKSETEARASEERMRRFVADASHELRTPLTSISGFAELYRQRIEAGDTPPETAMNRVESEAKRMAVLVEDLLLLARLDQQRPLSTEPVDLLDLAEDIVCDAPAISANHHVVLVVSDHLRQKPVIVIGDEMRLRQVMGNLMMNAYTHTPSGTNVVVKLYTEGDNAIFEVTDDGPGMNSEDAAKVFERFYRSDPSRTRASGGTGLGLSIVEGIIAAHGGEIKLETAPGEGARFIVNIPFVAADEDE